MRLARTSWIGLATLAVMTGGVGCAAILGADKDYHEVATGGSVGHSASSTSSASSARSSASSASSSGIGTGGMGGATSSTSTGLGGGVTVASSSAVGSSSSGTLTCTELDYTCLAAPPSGWSYVAFQPASQPACPTGFANPTTVEQAPAPGNDCTCTCGAPTENPCTANAQAQIRLGNNTMCQAATQVQVDGKCDSLGGQAIGTASFVRVQDLNPTHVACTYTATLPPLDPTVGRSCTLASEPPGCSSGEACVPPAAAGELCISTSGDVACPVLESTRYVVYAPPNVMDERACGTCNCTSEANTCAGTIALYADTTCSQMGVTAPVDGNCDMLSLSIIDPTSFILTVQPNTMQCQGAAQTNVTGQVATSSPTTICCM